jgi:ABC-type multidrug transport system fused ATPase/permease subunit
MQFLFTFYIMYTLDPWLTLVCCVPLPVIFLFTRLYSSRISGYLTRAKNQFGDLSGILVEGITGHKLIVTHGQESHITERFMEENRGYVKTSLDAALIQSLYRPSSAAMLAAGLSLVVYYGGQRVVAGLLTVGEMVLFGMYFTQLVGPVRMFARLIMFYQDALASARRVFEVIDVGEDVPEAQDAVELGEVRGEIVFDGVGFSYGGAETLTDINLKVAPSEKVALMGYVGSGKTTLAELVPRFYDVSTGRVTVDGVDVKKVKLDSLRRNVGIVLQDVYVFGDTIRNNIAFGRPKATAEEVERAARAAQIHEFIVGLPDGYETMIGERGITLSGGQRQRLTIARALLTDPGILILDDSTSNVDAETETLIRLAIDELLKGRTALIITQRASTCEAADRVVVMERGRIMAEGTHRQLLRSSPDYRRLIESQAFQLGGEL